MRCEMRAATLMRRSGWSEEMFVKGARVSIEGFGHRDDPRACYIEDIQVGDAAKINRNDQFTTQAVDTSNRPKRRPTGEPNITGDWAQEQYVIAVPPSGGGNLLPKSLIAKVESGELAMRDVPSSGWGPRSVTYTARGKAERRVPDWSTADNPGCLPTEEHQLRAGVDAPSTQHARARSHRSQLAPYSFERVIQVDLAQICEHHAVVAGHSSEVGKRRARRRHGRLRDGVLAAPVKHSDNAHRSDFARCREWVLTRDYVATDPVFHGPNIGRDQVLVAASLVPHPATSARLSSDGAPALNCSALRDTLRRGAAPRRVVASTTHTQRVG